jgi:hypothetical protein
MAERRGEDASELTAKLEQIKATLSAANERILTFEVMIAAASGKAVSISSTQSPNSTKTSYQGDDEDAGADDLDVAWDSDARIINTPSGSDNGS